MWDFVATWKRKSVSYVIRGPCQGPHGLDKVAISEKPLNVFWARAGCGVKNLGLRIWKSIRLKLEQAAFRRRIGPYSKEQSATKKSISPCPSGHLQSYLPGSSTGVPALGSTVDILTKKTNASSKRNYIARSRWAMCGLGSVVLGRFSSCLVLGPKDHVSIRITHPGARAQYK